MFGRLPMGPFWVAIIGLLLIGACAGASAAACAGYLSHHRIRVEEVK